MVHLTHATPRRDPRSTNQANLLNKYHAHLSRVSESSIQGNFSIDYGHFVRFNIQKIRKSSWICLVPVPVA